MTELLTAAQMRAIEQAAIASGAVTGLDLMERAGRGVVEAIWEEWPELAKAPHRAVVLCGPGNNGGDGFVVARLLKEWGWEVGVFLYGDPEKLPPDARVNYERWCGMGEVRDFAEVRDRPWKSDLNIDALFGTGLVRPLTDAVAELVQDWREMPPLGCDVAIDGPSGVCMDSGRTLGGALPAELTVTFHRAKIGHAIGEGPATSGRLRVVAIGLDQIGELSDEARARPAGWAFAPAPGGRVGREPGLPPGQEPVRAVDEVSVGGAVFKRSGHKYTHGHALILAGPPGRGGAARLAARGALRIGAGLVTVGCPPAALQENAAALTAIMLKPVADADAFGSILGDHRINALCLGPGLGTGEREAALVAAALGVSVVPGSTRDRGGPGTALADGGPGSSPGRQKQRRAVVLDADALTILSRHPDLFAALHDRCVLTPHEGEFARLFPDTAEKLNAPATTGPAYSKVDATREAAARAGCTVLFKGPDTVIADPSGRCAINSAHYDRAAPWLATAGSGDVLAGFIAGLLARGVGPILAAETAAWLHVECALSFGPGLIAEDLPEELPKVFRGLGL